MRRGAIRRGVVFAALVMALSAGAPTSSPRPVARPDASASQHPSARAQQAGLGLILQDILRSPAPSRPQGGEIEALVQGVMARSPHPVPRPVLRLPATRTVASTMPDSRVPRQGSVCGLRQIRGVAIAAIPAKLPGCGLSQPVRITEVSGVRLSRPAVMNCQTARTLNDWVRQGVKPAVGRRGGGLEALKVIADYSCRTRNSQPGAKISEHGKGRAIDIAGIYLRNGDYISFLEGWKNRRDGRILRAMHSSACGPFGTVLGPDANRFHRDHLHVDTASYRSGAYCR